MVFKNYFINDESIELNWNYIMTIPEFKQLETCQQSMKWHGEGNALIHTRNVVTQMNSIISNEEQYKNQGLDYKRIMVMSALFHDIGKTTTTIFKKDDWHSYSHEIEGEKIARKILFDEKDIYAREEVCALVRWHMHRITMRKKKDNRIEELFKLSFNAPMDKLIPLFYSDAKGSHCNDEVEVRLDISNIQHIEIISSTYQLSKNYNIQFPSRTNSHVREYLYNIGKIKPNNPTAFILIGISGAGKDTYVINHPTLFSNATVLSRDQIRIDLGYCKGDEKIIGTTQQEDNVTDRFNEMMAEAVKYKKDIVFNNMNIKKKYRDQYHEFLDKYDYNFIYIYIESPSLKDNVDRRKGQINEEIISSMINKIEWPTVDEYDQLLIDKQL